MLSVELWKKRLYWRATHRGLKEMDLLLGRFAKTCLPMWREEDLKHFEDLLDIPDHDLLEWILGMPPPPSLDNPILHDFLKDQGIPESFHEKDEPERRPHES